MTENSQIDLIKKPQSHVIPKNWKNQFLETYAETGNKTFSALNAGVTVRTVYNHIHSDSEFATNVELAKQNAIMVLHQEAWRRAMGEDIHDEHGEVIGRTRTSDKLLIFLLSSMSPADYGHGAIAAEQQRSEITHGGAQIKITLPENYRGKFTLGVEDAFPDASAVVDVEYHDVDSSEERQPIEISEHSGNEEIDVVEQSLDS